MSNITISNESLSFLQKHRNASMSKFLKPFVSFVHDSEDSDSDASSVMMTPKLREHSRKIDRSNLGNGASPVKLNLSRRFANAPSVTPSTIYQLASRVSEEDGNYQSISIKEPDSKRQQRSRSKTFAGASKDYPKSPDYDMDAIAENKSRSRSTKRSDDKGRPTKQLLEVSEGESEESLKIRRRSVSAKPVQVLPVASPKRRVKSPVRRSTKGTTTCSVDMVIESVVRASPSKRRTSVSPVKSKQTNLDPPRKQPGSRGRPKSKDQTNRNNRTLHDPDITSDVAETDDSVNLAPSVKQKSELNANEQRNKRKILPTSASRLEFDWNYSSDDAVARTPRKGLRSTHKGLMIPGPKSQSRSSTRLASQADSTEDEVHQSVSKYEGHFKTPPLIVDRPLTKASSKANPLTLLSASLYTASEDEHTESTEGGTPLAAVQNPRTPVRTTGRPTGEGSFTPNRSARKATVFVSPSLAANKHPQHTGHAGANSLTTPKSILKPSSTEGAYTSSMNFSLPPKSTVTTLESLEIVSPVRTTASRTETTMTSTVASFEVISSPVRGTPVSTPSVVGSQVAKIATSAQGGIKRKSASTLPTGSHMKRSRHQMNPREQPEPMNRELAIMPLESETPWSMEVERSTAVSEETFSRKVDPTRLNPYSAAVGDPVSSKQLMENREYRISFIELLPECFFSLRAHCRTSIVAVTGTLSVRCREPVTEKFLDTLNRIVDLVQGSLYHLQNIGDSTAHFQLIETLPST